MSKKMDELEAKGVAFLDNELNTLRLLPLQDDEKRTRLDGYKGCATMLHFLKLITDDQYGYYASKIERMRE